MLLSLCYGDSALLGSTIVDAGTAPYSFYWSSTQPISDSSLQNTYATPLANSTYFIQITDASNCSAYDSISIQVNLELILMPAMTQPYAIKILF